MSVHNIPGLIFDAMGWISIGLLLVLAVLLLRGPFRKYPLILAYCVVQLVLTAAESYWVHEPGKKLYTILYWTDELVLNLLLFLMVITFTYRALGDSPMRVATGKLLAVVCVAVLLLPLVLFKNPWSPSWLNHSSQLLSFGAAILNLGLWSALVGGGRRDGELLAVSAGLGIAVTGAAISYGVRGSFPKDWLWVPDVFMSVTFVVCMFIWCWAFRPRPAAPVLGSANATGSI